MLNEAFETGELTESQKRSVISLINKKGDQTLIKHCRPIRLATADYKIIYFILANRLKPIMPKKRNESHTCYVSSRYIGQNIRMVQGVISDLKSNKQTGILLDFR